MSPSPPKAAARFVMIRSLRVPDLLTLTNAACGTIAVFMCLNYLDTAERLYLWIGFAMFPAALVLDYMDGIVARHLGSPSAWGTDLDSLSTSSPSAWRPRWWPTRWGYAGSGT